MTPRRKAQDNEPVTIRFPRQLWITLTKLAKENKRSFNQQVIFIITKALEAAEGLGDDGRD